MINKSLLEEVCWKD